MKTIKLASECQNGDVIKLFNTQKQYVIDASYTKEGQIELICDEQQFIIDADLKVMVFEQGE